MRKLEDIYDAALTSNEILDWIDKLQAQQTNDVREVYNQICKIEEQSESIIKATINYKTQRHKLMGLRREHNRANVPRHRIKSEAELERVEVTIKQAQVKQARENLQQQEGILPRHVLIYWTSIHQPERLDAEIRRYEKYTKLLTFQESEDASLILPGLIPMKSVLGLPKSKKRLSFYEHDEGAESGLSKKESQTTDATLYTVTLPDGIEIQILDTPGLADTRGIEQDEQHKAKINKASKSSLWRSMQFLIMANGTTERMPAATNYTLGTLTSLFPHSIIENIAFIFTHCDSQWTLENPLAYRKRYRREAREDVPESTLKEGRDRLENIYKKTVCTLNEWLIWVEGCQAQPTHQINRLYETMLNIEAQIESAISLIALIGERKRAVRTAQQDLETQQTSKSAIEALCDQTIKYWDREDTDSKNTLCIVPGCHQNCHEKCGVPYTLDPVKLGQYCRAFKLENASWRRTWFESADQLNLHVERTKPLHPTAKSDLAEAETKEQKTRDCKEGMRRRARRIEVELDAAQAQVNSLVDDYNAKSLSGDFAGHINSAIQMLNLRLKELESKFGTEHEQGVVRDAIQKFKINWRLGSPRGYVQWCRGRC
ncbi:hypothetical protein RHS01_10338 [Rhizoctonia solani]|uniref:AIG1-type G domain-containing protein n=1 Tax=Rhizoctonia solani TaxID=456999 RepID=A0A8H7I256_9AGAM|nr:hypothetical protein RHS01_10338 [Rhizoctonia solani]